MASEEAEAELHLPDQAEQVVGRVMWLQEGQPMRRIPMYWAVPALDLIKTAPKVMPNGAAQEEPILVPPSLGGHRYSAAQLVAAAATHRRPQEWPVV
jgi:hypothetical protein